MLFMRCCEEPKTKGLDIYGGRWYTTGMNEYQDNQEPLIDQLAQKAGNDPIWAQEVAYYKRLWGEMPSNSYVLMLMDTVRRVGGSSNRDKLFVQLANVVLHELVSRRLEDRQGLVELGHNALDPQVSPPDAVLEAWWDTPPAKSNNPRDNK